MVYRYYRLPSLTALAAFEASARHRSMQRAANELNVTTGAVSRQIRALEEELGVPLFVRAPTGLVLTVDAEALYTVLSQSFSRTAEVVEVIRSGNRERRATLACTHALATQWLMPADLPDLPLLHVDWADAEWTGWDELLRRAGIPHGALPGRRFGSLGVVLRACEEDQGLAVGWHRLVRPLVEEGRIVPFTDLRIPAPGSYYLSWNASHEPGDAVRTLRDWLIEAAANEAG